MKRRKTSMVVGAVDQPHSRAPTDTTVFATMRHLVQHLAVCRYDDGQPRKPGRLFVETMGVSWLVVLKEPDEKLEMRCVGATLDDALALAELMLGADDPPWVPDEWARDRKPDGKKK